MKKLLILIVQLSIYFMVGVPVSYLINIKKEVAYVKATGIFLYVFFWKLSSFSIYILICDSYASLGQGGVLNALPYGAILAEIAWRQKRALAGHALQPVGGVVGCVEGRSQLFFFLIFTYLATSDLCSMQASCYGQEAQLPCDMWDPGSPTKDWTHVPLYWKADSQKLDHQGSPRSWFLSVRGSPITVASHWKETITEKKRNLSYGVLLAELLSWKTLNPQYLWMWLNWEIGPPIQCD